MENTNIQSPISEPVSSPTTVPEPKALPAQAGKPYPLYAIFPLLVLVLLACTVYFTYQNYQLRKQISQPQTQPSPTPTATPDETANWKTYTNSEFNFSFMYPPDWTKRENTPTSENLMIVFLNNPTIGTFQIQEGYLADGIDKPNIRFEYKDAVLSGKKVKLQNMYADNQLRQKTYEAKNNDKTIAILLNPETKENFEKLDQILSTFKFLSEPSKCLQVEDPCNPQACNYDQSKCNK